MLSGRIQLQKEPRGIQPRKIMLKTKNQLRNNKLEERFIYIKKSTYLLEPSD